MNSTLLLEDGTFIEGRGFGAEGTAYGEVVFTTGMVGYPESLTDPSYRGQILIMTHPLIGNYGVPSIQMRDNKIPLYYESDRIQVSGFIINKLMRGSHWTSIMELDEWLKRENIPGMEEVDTRALVKKIREYGVMMGALIVGETGEDMDKILEKIKEVRYDKIRFIDQTSPKHIITYEVERWDKKVIVVDTGVKYGILRELLKRKFNIIRIPYTMDPINALEKFNADCILFGNGPGNPALLNDLIEKAKNVIEYGVPTMGICLGCQIMALADGADIYKLKYGHRGLNKPVKDLETGKALITTQNHGYAIKAETLNRFKVWMINIDDKSVEAILHKDKPIIATQFHPEASPGPLDSNWIFDLFTRLVEGRYHGL